MYLVTQLQSSCIHFRYRLGQTAILLDRSRSAKLLERQRRLELVQRSEAALTSQVEYNRDPPMEGYRELM